MNTTRGHWVKHSNPRPGRNPELTRRNITEIFEQEGRVRICEGREGEGFVARVSSDPLQQPPAQREMHLNLRAQRIPCPAL